MASQKLKRSQISPRVKVWLEADGEYVFGLGICQILEAVDETGSIKKGADVVEKSYRHIWSRIKDVEKALGISLVETHVGGATKRRSSLTAAARELVSHYRKMRKEVFELVDQRFSNELKQIILQARQETHEG